MSALYDLRFKDGTSLTTTFDHPLYVCNKGWCCVEPEKESFSNHEVECARLEVGDCLPSLSVSSATSSISAAGELQPHMQRSVLESIKPTPGSQGAFTAVFNVTTEPLSNHRGDLDDKNFFANGFVAHNGKAERRKR